MRKLTIACAGSSNSRTWKNTEITWDDLCSKLSKTIRTSESVSEYMSMKKSDRDRIKNVGGYMTGKLKDGHRKAESVEFMDLLKFDADYAEPGFIESFRNNFGYAAVMYSTHSHTPESPRIRILVPLQRSVTTDEFCAVSRLLASEMNIEQFDECSFIPNQMMYWPSTPADGEYVFEVIDGEWLDPDSLLSVCPDWHNTDSLPKTSREVTKYLSDKKKQEDPLGKPGIVGAFCRAYGIRSAIEMFLPDIYEATVMEDRYTYIPGESAAGLVVYDDKFAYSHHATDPACNILCNSFDLVRIHKFGKDDCNQSFRDMCSLAGNDSRVSEILQNESLCDFDVIEDTDIRNTVKWEKPIPLDMATLPEFPVNALPEPMKDYVLAVAESTQTPVGMGACGVIATVALSIQKKYVIKVKPDWEEPLNLYSLIILPPSERKSAVLSADIKPALQYERDYNQKHSADFEASAARKRVLERKQHAAEEQAAKGKTGMDELDKISAERAKFRELTPMRLFVDDVTTEKLISVLAENDGKAAIVSAEGGIFDMLSGIYTKSVNIDAVLKGYSGDCIRVDRIGRQSESIMNPALTMLLMVQPSVLSGIMQNGTFRGRGLTARFLYCVPESKVGKREFTVKGIPDEVYENYAALIYNLLDDNPFEAPEEITLSPEAYSLIEKFALDLEPKLIGEYADISEWAGKLTGNVARMAGILCRSSVLRGDEILCDREPLIVSGEIMQNAIDIGNYFLEHAKAAFSIMGDDVTKMCRYVLDSITKEGLAEFTRRDIMRLCRRFKTAGELQPVLDRLSDYGYIAEKNGEYGGKGRPAAPTYCINPYIYED